MAHHEFTGCTCKYVSYKYETSYHNLHFDENVVKTPFFCVMLLKIVDHVFFKGLVLHLTPKLGTHTNFALISGRIRNKTNLVTPNY